MTDNHNLITQLHKWSSEDIYFSGNDYFNDLIYNIENAKQSVFFECYIFYRDTLGKKIINALIHAAQRNIEIRLIIDGYGSLNWNAQQLSELTDAGILIKIYHPLPWRISSYKRTVIRKNIFVKFIYLSSRINKRDHRKLYIIDRKTAWSGSMNISADHINRQAQIKPWFDCGIKIDGEPIIELVDNFNEIWNQKHLVMFENKHLPFRVNNNILRRKSKNSELVNLLESCNDRVWIISAYLAPSRHIINALKKAKNNGADVKLIISHHSDVIFFPLISTTYYAELLKAGIEIYENYEHIIHAKTILLDDIAFVGSSNLNHRSFLHDLEIDILLTKSLSLQTLKNKFNQLTINSNKISFSKLKNLPWYYNVLGKIIWNIRYWL